MRSQHDIQPSKRDTLLLHSQPSIISPCGSSEFVLQTTLDCVNLAWFIMAANCQSIVPYLPSSTKLALLLTDVKET
jgi:hypothetical protein